MMERSRAITKPLALTTEIAGPVQPRFAVPDVRLPAGDTLQDMNAHRLAKLSFEGMRVRYTNITGGSYEERLRFELDVIEKTGFGQYSDCPRLSS